MKISNQQFTGCLLGLGTGDALGAPHEGGPLERLVWHVIGRTREGRLRWTDDTQMAIDLGESLLMENGVRQDALARRFAEGYRWSRGYGPGTARVLRCIRRGEPWASASKAVYPKGSFGNGAAMRSPVLALFYPTDCEALIEAARASAEVTHAHPLAIEGTVLIASTTQALLNGRTVAEVLEVASSVCATREFRGRIETVASWVASNSVAGPAEVAKTLGNGTAAIDSCATALYIALRHLSGAFVNMQGFVVACKGDVDTIGAMAGALWGAANGSGALPEVNVEGRERLEGLALRLFRRYDSGAAGDGDH